MKGDTFKDKKLRPKRKKPNLNITHKAKQKKQSKPFHIHISLPSYVTYPMTHKCKQPLKVII